jgi:hypothetical protein
MLRRLGIEPGEGRVFAWGAAVLLLTGWADAALRNVAETLFLKRIGVEWLPVVFLANAVLLVGTTAWVGRSIARSDRPRLLPRVLLLLAALLVPLAWLARSGVEWGLHGLLIASKQLPSISLLVFWGAMGDLLHARQAKRLFAPLVGGFTLGGITGSFASEPLGRWLSVAGLVPCAAAALLIAAAVALPLRTLRPLRFVRGAASEPQEEAPLTVTGIGGLWRTSQLFRLLVVSTLCSGLVAPMLYYQFSYVADLATAGAGGEHRLLSFYARFRGWINTGALLLQLLVATRLYRRVGVPLAALVSPLVYLVGFVGLSVRLSLPTGVFAMAGTKLVDAAVFDPAQRIFYSLFSEDHRARAAAWLDGPVKRAGGVLGNVIVLGVVALGGAGLVGEAALPVSVAWCAAALLLWRRYPGLLLEASAQHATGVASEGAAALLDPATVRALAAELRTEDAERCRLAISLLSDAPAETAVRAFAEAARDAPAATRGLLIEALDRLLEAPDARPARATEAAEALAKLLEAGAALSVRERADVVQAWGRLAPEEAFDASDVLERALRDPAAAVRLAALSALHQRGRAPSQGEPLDHALARAVAAGDAEARRTAREELRALLACGPPDAAWTRRLETLAQLLARPADRAEAAEALAEVARRRGAQAAGVAPAVLAWCEDPDPRVRAALLRFTGHAGLRERAAWLVAHLGASPAALAEAARDGLRALGPAVVDALLVELGFGMRSKREAVLGLLRELAIDRATLRRLYEQELGTIRHTLVQLAVLSGGDTAAVVLARLEERLSECQRTALHYLSAAHDDDRIAELGELMARAGSPRQRAILIEALEALLTPREQAELVPLLEDPGLDGRGRNAARALGVPLPSREAATRALLEDPDELLRLLTAATAAPTLAPEAGLADPVRVLTPVEIMLHLRSLPIFERLTTRELMDLALVVREEDHAAGSLVVREGEFSDCLYLVVDGRVEITKSGQLLAEIGPKSFFGEIAVFEGAARSATAQAAAPTRLLRLGRTELLRLMEEFPGIAIGVCQNLSRRVRELTDRVLC